MISNRERQAAWAARQAERGFVKAAVLIPVDQRAALTAFAKALCAGTPPEPEPDPRESKAALRRQVKALQAEILEMKKQFHAELGREVSERLQTERAKLREIEADIKAKQDYITKNAAGITPMMTQEEFRLVRGLLHPDRHPDDAAKYKRAFEIFNRLGEAINPNIPVAVLRKEGWA